MLGSVFPPCISVAFWGQPHFIKNQLGTFIIAPVNLADQRNNSTVRLLARSHPARTRAFCGCIPMCLAECWTEAQPYRWVPPDNSCPRQARLDQLVAPSPPQWTRFSAEPVRASRAARATSAPAWHENATTSVRCQRNAARRSLERHFRKEIPKQGCYQKKLKSKLSWGGEKNENTLWFSLLGDDIDQLKAENVSMWHQFNMSNINDEVLHPDICAVRRRSDVSNDIIRSHGRVITRRDASWKSCTLCCLQVRGKKQTFCFHAGVYH